MLNHIMCRNRDLMAAVRAEMAARGSETFELNEVMEKVVNSPAPYYYVSYDYALKRVRQAKHGKLPAGMAEIRRRQWEEIAGKVTKLMEVSGLKLSEALTRVIMFESASSFFITAARGVDLYHEYRRRARTRMAA